VEYKATEHQIQDSIIGYLRMKGFYVMRMNSGKYSVGEGRSKRFIRGHEAGTPDLLAFRKSSYPSMFFIEVKVPGNKPTALQKAKMEQLEDYGAMCIVATSVEDLQKMNI
jgi:Holliday junction resolvase